MQSQQNSNSSLPDDKSNQPSPLSKKVSNTNFYNSTYDSTYSVTLPSSNNESNLGQQQPIPLSTDDLAQLESFDEQSIITYMYNRFLANQIYTYIGDILVVSNLSTPSRSTNQLFSLFRRLLTHFVHCQSMVKMP